MCNVQEDFSCLNEYESNSSLKIDNLQSRICKKCNEAQAKVVLRGNDVYCKSCFLTSATHKFRATLGKSHLIRPGDKVLVAYNGDPSSSALLHLVENGLSQNTHKKLRFEPLILYVEESISSNTNQGVPLSEIVDKMKSTNLPYNITSLSQALGPEISFVTDLSSFVIDEQLDKELVSIISKFKTPTAKQDFLKKLKYKLIASVAISLQCKYVFVGDICTNIASTLLSNIALGRGSHLPYDVAFMDTRFSKLKILRPLRDFVTEEILYYNSFNNIIPINKTQKSDANSIQKLTKTFINDLQENFPATVYTIFRTGEKLSTNNESTEISEPCRFCKAPLDNESSNSTALQATKFSKLVSNIGPNKDIPTESIDCVYENFCKDINLGSEVQKVDIERHLCYGCTLILQDLDKGTDLPELFNNLCFRNS